MANTSERDWNKLLTEAAARQLSEVYNDPEPTPTKGLPVKKHVGERRVIFRPGAELDSAMAAFCADHGISVSEFLRLASERMLARKVCPSCRGTGFVAGAPAKGGK